MKEHVFSYRNRLQQSYRIWYILLSAGTLSYSNLSALCVSETNTIIFGCHESKRPADIKGLILSFSLILHSSLSLLVQQCTFPPCSTLASIQVCTCVFFYVCDRQWLTGGPLTATKRSALSLPTLLSRFCEPAWPHILSFAHTPLTYLSTTTRLSQI